MGSKVPTKICKQVHNLTIKCEQSIPLSPAYVVAGYKGRNTFITHCHNMTELLQNPQHCCHAVPCKSQFRLMPGFMPSGVNLASSGLGSTHLQRRKQHKWYTSTMQLLKIQIKHAMHCNKRYSLTVIAQNSTATNWPSMCHCTCNGIMIT